METEQPAGPPDQIHYHYHWTMNGQEVTQPATGDTGWLKQAATFIRSLDVEQIKAAALDRLQWGDDDVVRNALSIIAEAFDGAGSVPNP